MKPGENDSEGDTKFSKNSSFQDDKSIKGVPRPIGGSDSNINVDDNSEDDDDDDTDIDAEDVVNVYLDKLGLIAAAAVYNAITTEGMLMRNKMKKETSVSPSGSSPQRDNIDRERQTRRLMRRITMLLTRKKNPNSRM